MDIDIELVIKIPKKDFEFIKQSEGARYSQTIIEAVVNGTPLPKGHGTLIDSDKLIDKWAKTTVRGRTEFDQVIMCEPTVISAESEDSNEST